MSALEERDRGGAALLSEVTCVLVRIRRPEAALSHRLAVALQPVDAAPMSRGPLMVAIACGLSQKVPTAIRAPPRLSTSTYDTAPFTGWSAPRAPPHTTPLEAFGEADRSMKGDHQDAVHVSCGQVAFRLDSSAADCGARSTSCSWLM